MALGAFPSQMIRELRIGGHIIGGKDDNIQPSSIDLSITNEVYKMKGIFLPQKGESIDKLVEEASLYKTDLSQPLDVNGIYFIKLDESLKLPPGVYGYANNKSSTGRVNVQTRLLADGVSQFDRVPAGYEGPLWLVVSPRSFAVRLHEGDALNQLRLFNADTRLNTSEHGILYDRFTLCYDKNGNAIPSSEIEKDRNGGITLTVDLDRDLVGYKCAASGGKLLDYDRRDLDPMDFFEPIYRPKDGRLILRRDEFYILVTREFLRVPPDFAVEMVAYDTSKGEFRSHYAGFFDPGFGWGNEGDGKGTICVLEVLPYDNDFILRDGQPICKMVYERLATTPDMIYGRDIGSHYQFQNGPKLSKHFSMEGNTKSPVAKEEILPVKKSAKEKNSKKKVFQLNT